MAREITVKSFTGSGVPIPGDWARAVGMPTGRFQGSILVTAMSKRDVPDLLTDRKMGQGAADRLAKELSMVRGEMSWHPVLAMVAAGLIDLGAVAVHVWYQGVNGNLIGRVEHEPAGEVTIVGRFVYDGHVDGRGLYVEPVTEGA